MRGRTPSEGRFVGTGSAHAALTIGSRALGASEPRQVRKEAALRTPSQVPRLRPIRAGDTDTSGDTDLDDGARGRALVFPAESGIRRARASPLCGRGRTPRERIRSRDSKPPLAAASPADYPWSRRDDTSPIVTRSHGGSRFGVPWEAVAVAFLLVAALLLRLPDLDRPSIEQRENQSSLIARGWYLAGRDDIPAWQRRVLDEVDTVLKPYEPPLLELAATAFYRATGGERIWFPRLLSTLAWLAGAVCLAFLARRLTNAAGMLTAVALYLAWPYAFWQSRKFMPDSLLVACILAATLAIVLYWERPSRARFVGAAAAAAIATAIKPGVGLFFVVAVFVALALAHGRLRAEIRSGRLVVFAGIAASLAVLYFVIGIGDELHAPGRRNRPSPARSTC